MHLFGEEMHLFGGVASPSLVVWRPYCPVCLNTLSDLETGPEIVHFPENLVIYLKFSIFGTRDESFGVAGD